MGDTTILIKDKKDLFDTMKKLIDQNIDPVEREDDLWDRYSKELAVLILDSVGFTRITREFGTIYFLTCILRMREVILPIFEDHGCMSTTTENDSIFAYFQNPNEALKAAFEANSILKEKKIMLTPDEPFRICIGIGYGKLLYSETLEGYYGNEMNLASKLGEDTAKGNEILITEAVFRSIPDNRKEIFNKKEIVISGNFIEYYETVFSS